MKEVISGTFNSSKENFNILNSRKNSIKLKSIIDLIKIKKYKSKKND